MSSPALSTLSDGELRERVVSLGHAPWRADQLRHAVWRPQVSDFASMLNVPAALRDQLAGAVRFSAASVAAETTADAGRTLKLLCRLDDGLTIETVAMATAAQGASRRRCTVCVSTQVGCAVGCPFCATGHMGLRRNCSAAEIVDQVRVAAHSLHRHGLGPVTHVVYMGMGEPLANYDATLDSLRVLTGAAGIGARRITVSTSGVVPAIEQLAREAPPVTLAISLHAATDELRDRLVPLNRAHPIAALVAAGTRYARATGRRLTFEWCLIGGINDTDAQAVRLRELARSARAHVNVIPMNRIHGSPWGPPDPSRARAFLGQLRGIPVTVRDTRGGDVDAACGQLRALLEARRELRADGTLTAPRRPLAV